MGEWSKSVGEKGEKIMSFFFKEILGFNTVLENQSVECLKEKKHKRPFAKGDRTTHGIDGLISYKNPLEDRTLEILVASSKFTSKKYSSSPKTEFKSHITDLAYAIECFKNSKLNSETKKQFSDVDRTDVTGVIVWTSNKSPLDYALIPHISNSQLDSDLDFDRIIVIDNERFNFLYDTVYSTRRLYDDDKVSIIYHNTSLNNSMQTSTRYGKILPIQYAVSDLIPLRIENGDRVEILVFCKNDFNAENFAQVLSFAKSFDHLDLVNKTTIAFANYDDLESRKIVESQLFNFDNYKLGENLFVKKFPSDFRNN